MRTEFQGLGHLDGDENLLAVCGPLVVNPDRDFNRVILVLAANDDPDILRLSEHLESDGPTIFHNACKMHAEGIISALDVAAVLGR